MGTQIAHDMHPKLLELPDTRPGMICIPKLKSLASPVAEIIKMNAKNFISSVPQGQAHFFALGLLL